MDNLPVGRIEQLTYNDKLKADIAELMAAQDGVSEKGRLQAEVARLQAENAALTAWGKRAYHFLNDAKLWTPIQVSKAAFRLCDNAPDSVKGNQHE